MSRSTKLTITFDSDKALRDYVAHLNSAGLIPGDADVYPADSLDTVDGYIVCSAGDGRTNGVLGREPG